MSFDPLLSLRWFTMDVCHEHQPVQSSNFGKDILTKQNFHCHWVKPNTQLVKVSELFNYFLCLLNHCKVIWLTIIPWFTKCFHFRYYSRQNLQATIIKCECLTLLRNYSDVKCQPERRE